MGNEWAMSGQRVGDEWAFDFNAEKCRLPLYTKYMILASRNV
jgi:hypothetical protein